MSRLNASCSPKGSFFVRVAKNIVKLGVVIMVMAIASHPVHIAIYLWLCVQISVTMTALLNTPPLISTCESSI